MKFCYNTNFTFPKQSQALHTLVALLILTVKKIMKKWKIQYNQLSAQPKNVVYLMMVALEKNTCIVIKGGLHLWVFGGILKCFCLHDIYH